VATGAIVRPLGLVEEPLFMKIERVLGLAQKWFAVLYWLVKLVEAVMKLMGGATSYNVRHVQA
jgi:hypothetical protein